jgi:hypothetical protein
MREGKKKILIYSINVVYNIYTIYKKFYIRSYTVYSISSLKGQPYGGKKGILFKPLLPFQGPPYEGWEREVYKRMVFFRSKAYHGEMKNTVHIVIFNT